MVFWYADRITKGVFHAMVIVYMYMYVSELGTQSVPKGDAVEIAKAILHDFCIIQLLFCMA